MCQKTNQRGQSIFPCIRIVLAEKGLHSFPIPSVRFIFGKLTFSPDFNLSDGRIDPKVYREADRGEGIPGEVDC